ncbi:hypothetical protein D3C76_1459540 [compost metagenome]
MVASSAVVGSSAINSSGWQESAIAIITRWRIPPLNSCGYWFSRCSGSRMPTCRSISAASLLASALFNPRCLRMTSVNCWPIFLTGFSEVIGS